MLSRARISKCGKYRWQLERDWGAWGARPLCCFVMLNPSTADATKDDATIRNIVRRCEEWGYGWLVVVNLGAAVWPR